MKPEHPNVEHVGSPTTDSIERHPAYGQIGANRVSGSRYLYGSDFEHNHYVIVRISRSELHRSLSNDWPFARDELIEVALSEAQWATFVSTLNSGGGTQCTIGHIDRHSVPGIARLTDRHAQFRAEMNDRTTEVIKDAERLVQMVEKGGRKQEMRSLSISLLNFLKSNVQFIADQFGEHMEKVTEHAKIEVSAYIESHIKRAGLESLGAAPPPIELPRKEE